MANKQDNLDKKKNESQRQLPPSRNWKALGIQEASKFLASLPLRDKTNITADALLFLILFVGGKYYLPMPSAVKSVGFLFCLFFVAGCFVYYRLRRR